MFGRFATGGMGAGYGSTSPSQNMGAAAPWSFNAPSTVQQQQAAWPQYSQWTQGQAVTPQHWRGGLYGFQGVDPTALQQAYQSNPMIHRMMMMS